MYVEIHVPPPNSWFSFFEVFVDLEYIMNITLSL